MDIDKRINYQAYSLQEIKDNFDQMTQVMSSTELLKLILKYTNNLVLQKELIETVLNQIEQVNYDYIWDIDINLLHYLKIYC